MSIECVLTPKALQTKARLSERLATCCDSNKKILIPNHTLSLSLARSLACSVSLTPRSGELRTQKLKSHLMRTQSLKVLPLKPGVGQYIAMYVTLTARDFFFANFYPFGPATCIFFPKPLLNFSCVSCGYHQFLRRPAEQNRSPCWMQVPVLSAHGI